MILGSIDTDTIESSRVWLDDTESLSFSKFSSEWGFVSEIFCLSLFFGGFFCIYYALIFVTVRGLVFVFRRNVQSLHPEVCN